MQENIMTRAQITPLLPALLLNEGDIIKTKDNNYMLYATFQVQKTGYIWEYLQQESFDNYTLNNGQLKVQDHTKMSKLRSQWYTANNIKKLDDHNINQLTLSSLLMWINLYGERTRESIVVPCDIHTDYLPCLSKQIKSILQVDVSIHRSKIKINNPLQLLHRIRYCSNIIHLSQFMHLITNKEVKLMSGGGMALCPVLR